MNQSDEKDPQEDWFEHDLMRAMRRVDAPQGFASRVMNTVATAEAPPAKRIMMRQTVRVWLTGAIAAGLLAGIFLAERTHLRLQREERVQRQFEVAIRITDRALERTREQLARSASGFGD